MCWNSWGCKESDTTKQLNWTEVQIASELSIRGSYPVHNFSCFTACKLSQPEVLETSPGLRLYSEVLETVRWGGLQMPAMSKLLLSGLKKRLQCNLTTVKCEKYFLIWSYKSQLWKLMEVHAHIKQLWWSQGPNNNGLAVLVKFFMHSKNHHVKHTKT